MSAFCGRCCHPQIAVSDYSILGQVFSPPWGARNTKFHQSHFPIGGRTQVDGLSQFHREIGVRNLHEDVARGVAEQSDVKVTLHRHTF